MMAWRIERNEAVAASSFHHGSPFFYYFVRRGDGWHNKTDPEIVTTPMLPVFTTVEAARGWAERNEASMDAIHRKRLAAAPTATEGSSHE